MRRTCALILLCFLIMTTIMSGCDSVKTSQTSINSIKSYQDIPGVTDDEKSSIEKFKTQKNSLTYGHMLEMEAFLLKENTYEGFTTVFCLLLSELFGIEFVQISYDSWQQLRSDIDNCVIDFTADLTLNTELKNIYASTVPIADRKQKIITLKGVDFAVEEDINGLKLGFLEHSVNIESILRSYPNLSFEAVNVDKIASIEGMLESGEIDAFVTERNLDKLFEENNRIQIEDFFPMAYTTASLITANRELEPFLSVINKYLAAGGTAKLNNMYSSSEFENTKQRLLKLLTDEELEYLNKVSLTGVSIALESDNYPCSFYNRTEKEFQGIAVDVLNEIGKLTGIDFKNTTTPETTWTQIIDSLKTKKISLVSELGYSESRAKYFIWSETPYSSTNYTLISKSDFPRVEIYQIPQMRVGVVANTIYEEVYKEWFPDYDNFIYYSTYEVMLDALEKDKLDLVMGSENVLQTQVNYREKTGYSINYSFTAKLDSTFGFNKDEALLRSIVDKALRQVDVNRIESNWKSRVFNYSQKISQVRTTYLSVFASGASALLVVMVFMFLKNKNLDKKLLERTTMLSAIYASMPETIFCKDTEGRYINCNPSFERQAGLPEDELIGKTYAEVFKERVSDNIKKYADIDKKIINERISETTEETVIYPDGSVKVLETLKVPLIQDGKVVGILGTSRDVTEHIKSKNQLARIINTAQIAFILTTDGIVLEANEYSKQIFGVNIGDTSQNIYSNPGQRGDIIKKVDEHGSLPNVIVGFKMANGETHRFMSSFTSVEYEQHDSYIVWALDIEEDELKNDRLNTARQSLQSILDALPMPVRIVDTDNGEIVYVNNSFLELFEYESAEEVCGLHISKILQNKFSDGTDSNESINVILEAIDSVSLDIEYRTKTERIIEAMVICRPIDYMGRHSSIGIIKDLTAEKERERLLKEAVEREKEANQTKTLFLANMSHEIRTPMNGVIGMTDLLLGEHLSGRQLQYVKDIKISAESLLNIINDILDLSKITEGRLQIAPVDIDISTLLKNTVSMMSFTAHSKGLTFIDDIQLNMPKYVRIDDVRLKQIIVNLLSNAIKFTKEGSVKLSVKVENSFLCFEVSDTGIGIKKEELPLIFMAFEQADKRKNRAIKGTGLGLSISKNLVELMGGNIWVESEYGTGSTFFVTLPYVPGDESAVETVDTVFEYVSAPMAQVLLVDDIQTNLTVGAGLLRHCKITADVAVSGKEAIELISKKDYDLVFMDHMMPEMDGIEATGLIRNMGKKFRELPIIALTANAVNESKELLISSGMNDFLSKPIDKAALMGILKKWLPSDKIVLGEEPSDAKLPYSETLSAASKIDGLDVELALRRISGMQDVLEASMKQVAHSIPERLKKMDDALARNDLHSFGIDAHGLKGALANIGATINSEMATGLEIAAKADNAPLCLEKFAVFADMINGFAGELKMIFEQRETEDKPDGDNGLLMVKVNEAIACLSRFETVDSLNCLNDLAKFTFGKETDAILDEATSLIKSFKHKKAGLMLKSISTALLQNK